MSANHSTVTFGGANEGSKEPFGDCVWLFPILRALSSAATAGTPGHYEYFLRCSSVLHFILSRDFFVALAFIIADSSVPGRIVSISHPSIQLEGARILMCFCFYTMPAHSNCVGTNVEQPVVKH
jgi:hypothetical protein